MPTGGAILAVSFAGAFAGGFWGGRLAPRPLAESPNVTVVLHSCEGKPGDGPTVIVSNGAGSQPEGAGGSVASWLLEKFALGLGVILLVVLGYVVGTGRRAAEPNRAQPLGPLPWLPAPSPTAGAGGVVGW